MQSSSSPPRWRPDRPDAATGDVDEKENSLGLLIEEIEKVYLDFQSYVYPVIAYLCAAMTDALAVIAAGLAIGGLAADFALTYVTAFVKLHRGWGTLHLEGGRYLERQPPVDRRVDPAEPDPSLRRAIRHWQLPTR